VTQYRLFPSSNGPASGTPTGATPFQAGVIFQVTANGLWLNGIYYWCAASGQSTGAITCALWQPVDATTFVLVPGTSAGLAGLTAGAWNFIPFPAPVGLSAKVPYTAVVAYASTTSFAFTGSQFGSGQPFSAGITNGPLFAFSDAGGSTPAPDSQPQGLFGTGAASGGNANANYPGAGSSGSANFHVDVLVDSSPPGGAAAYQLWPGQPRPVNSVIDDTTALGGVVTVATEFKLGQLCALSQILVYSPAGATSLPSKCAIYSVNTQAQVAGTLQSSPAWKNASGGAASPADGWISASYAGVTLPAGDYKCAAAGTAGKFNATTGPDYWQGAGPGANGIANGPLSAPNGATAASPGQSTYNGGGADIAYPLTIQAASAYTYWVDVLVQAIALPYVSRVACQAVQRSAYY
jgi:hypothetical protein